MNFRENILFNYWKILGILVICLPVFCFQVYAGDNVSKEHKKSTLKHIQTIKKSLGIEDDYAPIEANEKSSNKSQQETLKSGKTALAKSDIDESAEGKKTESVSQEGDLVKSDEQVSYENINTTGIKTKYLGVSRKEMYPSEEKGPTIVSRLDPYHPEHQGLKVPYYKDREGLKIHPWVGVRGEYKQDEKLVGIESLIMEAKEWSQTTDSELRDYISTSDKHYTRGEVILHYKETWPVFTFIHHNERVTRQYEAKKLWPSTSNDMYYDNYDKKYYKLEYTIPNLPQIGYLDITTRYGSERGYAPNDNEGYTPFDSYLLALKCMPVYDVELKVEGEYLEGDNPRFDGIDDWEERKLFIEMKKLFPRQYITAVFHYQWKDKENLPTKGNDEWITHETGLRIKKEINGNLDFTTDWTHINYARDKSRESSYEHISTRAITIENDLTYEFIRDWKFTLGLDYGAGLDDFDGFDNYTVRGELMYRKPGLADWRIGLRHTEYYNINDDIDTVYFKIGLFI